MMNVKALRSMYLHKTIKIVHLTGEDSRYDGRSGEVEYVDDMGQLHGTWGGLAVIPGEDKFTIIED